MYDGKTPAKMIIRTNEFGLDLIYAEKVSAKEIRRMLIVKQKQINRPITFIR